MSASNKNLTAQSTKLCLCLPDPPHGYTFSVCCSCNSIYISESPNPTLGDCTFCDHSYCWDCFLLYYECLYMCWCCGFENQPPRVIGNMIWLPGCVNCGEFIDTSWTMIWRVVRIKGLNVMGVDETQGGEDGKEVEEGILRRERIKWLKENNKDRDASEVL